MQYTLKELRARKNLSQREVAKLCGVTETTYRSWESYPGKIQIKKLYLLADIFNVKIDDIFVGVSTPFEVGR